MTMHSFYVFYTLKKLQARMLGHPPEDTPTVRENNPFSYMAHATKRRLYLEYALNETASLPLLSYSASLCVGST
jgi:hypothetical protein